MHEETSNATNLLEYQSSFAEEYCGAVFYHQKMRLYAEARHLILGPDFDRWRIELEQTNYQQDEYVMGEWILDSQSHPPALLVKTMLFQGVIHTSNHSDLAALRAYVLDWLSLIQESAITLACQQADLHGINERLFSNLTIPANGRNVALSVLNKG
ncbi:hypothetical protein HAQ01_05020 [Acidithiobacillus thiooxidans]|uniref:hypothetical protein n=1 Tax=Acidithiobacillus thiooxidans TaxID=930 RepID=UPI001C0725EB|nr:hypothetical protein [Acidithiobacillus thiooxidans]MBU2792755.1 hypothetical protein [Acidithiobacillus thiooxidans]